MPRPDGEDQRHHAGQHRSGDEIRFERARGNLFARIDAAGFQRGLGRQGGDQRGGAAGKACRRPAGQVLAAKLDRRAEALLEFRVLGLDHAGDGREARLAAERLGDEKDPHRRNRGQSRERQQQPRSQGGHGDQRVGGHQRQESGNRGGRHAQKSAQQCHAPRRPISS